MIKQLLLVILLLIVSNIKAFATFNGGIKLNSGYSINNTLANELWVLHPEFDNTIPTGIGGFVEYEKGRLVMHTSISMEYSNVRITYDGIDDSGFLSSSHTLFGGVGLKEQYNAFAFKVPFGVQYKLLKNLYLCGSYGAEIQVNSKIKERVLPFWELGINSRYKKVCWGISMSGYSKARSYSLPKNAITINHPNIGVLCKSRSINLSVSYILWSE